MTVRIESGTSFGPISVLRSGGRITLFQNASSDEVTSQDVLSLVPGTAADLAAGLIRVAEDRGGPVTNALRALWAGSAVAAYRASHKGDDDPQVALADLLCDLQHYAAAEGLGFDDALGTADRNYAEETASEAEHGPGAAG
jgi:hypothetical protein